MFGTLTQRLLARVPARRVARNVVSRFRGDERGVTAIEFGMVATPFIALLFAIIETALTLWTTQVLDTGITNAARRIYTGQFQQDNAATTDPNQLATKFREEICKSVVALLTCDKIKIDVRAFDSFPNQNAPPPIKNGQFDSENFGKYESPGANKIVVVRAAVEYPVFVSLLNPNAANLQNGNRLLLATATFRTEPFAQ
jgi:Flp pilus assembly protein TadG